MWDRYRPTTWDKEPRNPKLACVASSCLESSCTIIDDNYGAKV